MRIVKILSYLNGSKHCKNMSKHIYQLMYRQVVYRAFSGISLLLVAACSFLSATRADVTLNVGDNFQDSINHYPGNTTFIIKAGLHRGQNVMMKSGNTFMGEDGAIVNGSIVLPDWSPTGNYWVCSGGQSMGSRFSNGTCSGGVGLFYGLGCPSAAETTDPTCTYKSHLFIDGNWMKHVGSLDAMADDSCWYVDYNNNNIYIRVNPAGHLMEISSLPHAFGGTDVNDITIRNLVIENYATESQGGAINEYEAPNSNSLNWLIEDCELRNNHGDGITMVSGSHHVIRNNFLHDNGCLGMAMSSIVGGLVEGNEMSYNNRSGFSNYWEGGGIKFCECDSLTVRGNYCHHNACIGLWGDVNNTNTIIEGNRCEYNSSMGIFYEISGSGIIRCNISCFNGWGYLCWVSGGQISASVSCDVEIYNNYVETTPDYGNGIVFRQQMWRGMCGIISNIYVHHNTIMLHGNGDQWHVNTNGADCDDESLYDQVFQNIHFDYNQYHVPNLGGNYWRWDKLPREGFPYAPLWDWAGFQSKGQEEHGSIDDNLSIEAALPSNCDSLSVNGGNHPIVELVKKSMRCIAVNFETQSRRLSIILSAPRAGASVTLYDALGHRTRPTEYFSNANITVDMHGFHPGVYFAAICNGARTVKRVVISR